MKSPISKYSIGCALLALAAFATIGAQHLLAQEAAGQLHGYYAAAPWTGGTVADALAQSQQGTTIPMIGYSVSASKDGNTYTGSLVGGNFESATTTKIPVVVVPLKLEIGSAVFDPDADNSCDGNVSALNRFKKSPLVVHTPLKFNGVSVGTTQYSDGFERAEFWSLINSKFHNYLSPIKYAKEITVTADSSVGITYSSGCSELGIVSYSPFSSFLSSEVTTLQKDGIVSPTEFVVFLVKNLVQSGAQPPTASNCCILGFHTAQGSPAQTWGVMDYDVSGDFGAGTHDVSVASHEINEWINDPLVNNATPAWGNIGQVGGCQGNFEVGDPLSGTLMPTITLGGYPYHVQELAFFSWYFTADGDASYGTGGKFSGNGTFGGPSKACPPGGTYQ
jgi:hypothetical protein